MQLSKQEARLLLAGLGAMWAESWAPSCDLETDLPGNERSRITQELVDACELTEAERAQVASIYEGFVGAFWPY